MRPMLWAVSLCALLGIAPQAFAEQWVKVVTYPNGSEEYVDLESIKLTDDGLTQFWSRTHYPKPMQLPSGRSFSRSLALTSINCARSTYAILQSSVYTAQGEAVSSMTDASYLEMPPGSIVAQLAKRFCELSPASKEPTQVPPKWKQPNTAKNELVTGTGFYVTSVGHVITNAHVVSGCNLVQAASGVLTVLAIDEASDLALLQAKTTPAEVAKLRSGRGPKPGEAVVAIGFPLIGLLGSDPSVTTGVISSLAGIKNDRRFIQITTPVQPGSSGGPLFGENGAVIGVVVGKLNAIAVAQTTGDIPQNVNFAVALGTLQSFLDANNVAYEVNDKHAAETPADIATHATSYTILLQCRR
jgi:S1-C subfamily serine protease